MNFLIFLLASYGLTNIITSGKIFGGFRAFVNTHSESLGYFIKCPMCIGFWIGALLAILGGFRLIDRNAWTNQVAADVANAIVAGAAASGACWIARVILHRLDEDSL